MKRFTRENVNETLRLWPLAVSADEGDLKILHEICCAGKQIWRDPDRLRWPDYLWLDLEYEFQPLPPRVYQRFKVNIPDPSGTFPDVSYLGETAPYVKAVLPPNGTYRVAQRVTCYIEVKALDANVVKKMRSYRPGVPWIDFFRAKLNHFFSGMKDADEQIAGGKRLLGSNDDKRGVVIVVNEGSPGLPNNIACPHLHQMLRQLPNVDAILYLANDMKDKWGLSMIWKRDDDRVLQRFLIQAQMMFNAVEFEGNRVVSRLVPQPPQLVCRIEMDDRSLAMCRTWCAGWRRADDTTSVRGFSMTMSVVPREKFQSGLEPGLRRLEPALRAKLNRKGRSAITH